jgi:hypothetical protein
MTIFMTAHTFATNLATVLARRRRRRCEEKNKLPPMVSNYEGISFFKPCWLKPVKRGTCSRAFQVDFFARFFLARAGHPTI